LIVAAITSGERARYDVQVEVKAPEGGLPHNSIVLLNQIRTIDKRRVGRYWGRLSAQTMHRVDDRDYLPIYLNAFSAAIRPEFTANPSVLPAIIRS
jgi:hypothetical protein